MSPTSAWRHFPAPDTVTTWSGRLAILCLVLVLSGQPAMLFRSAYDTSSTWAGHLAFSSLQCILLTVDHYKMLAFQAAILAYDASLALRCRPGAKGTPLVGLAVAAQVAVSAATRVALQAGYGGLPLPFPFELLLPGTVYLPTAVVAMMAALCALALSFRIACRRPAAVQGQGVEAPAPSGRDGCVKGVAWGLGLTVILTPLMSFVALGMALMPARGNVSAAMFFVALAALGPLLGGMSLVGYTIANCCGLRKASARRTAGWTLLGTYGALGGFLAAAVRDGDVRLCLTWILVLQCAMAMGSRIAWSVQASARDAGGIVTPSPNGG